MSNKTYDILKVCCLVIIPVIAFISTICEIWNVPYSQQVTATLVALDTLLGAVVKISNDIYNKNKELELQAIKAINQQEDK